MPEAGEPQRSLYRDPQGKKPSLQPPGLAELSAESHLERGSASLPGSTAPADAHGTEKSWSCRALPNCRLENKINDCCFKPQVLELSVRQQLITGALFHF